jgi:ribulose bisphosphate carboxylase small subunit
MTASFNPKCTSIESTHRELAKQLAHCLRQGCVLCIEHAAQAQPRYTRWETWGSPRCFGGSLDELLADIAACRRSLRDRHIRLKIEDPFGRSRMVFALQRPVADPA